MAVVEFKGFSQMYRKFLFEVRFANSRYKKLFISKFNLRLDKYASFVKAHETKLSDVLVNVTFSSEISSNTVEKMINKSIGIM